jgi:sulfur carrier protein ThiS
MKLDCIRNAESLSMPLVDFTPHLKRYAKCDAQEVVGTTVCEALNAVFENNSVLRGYVLDEHGALRHHMVIFVDGEPVQDRRKLSDPVSVQGRVLVMQALSGG